MERSFKIGLAVKPQGVRGEIKVRPLTDDPERFKLLKEVYIDGEAHKVLGARIGAGEVFISRRTGRGAVFYRRPYRRGGYNRKRRKNRNGRFYNRGENRRGLA